jgi:HK97 gp10 family phage protein
MTGSPFRLTFTGGPELARALADLPKAVQGKTLTDALVASAQPVIEEAERLAPKSAVPKPIGHMAAHIEPQATNRREHGKTVVVGPDREHFYGLFPEFGTQKMPARPFLRPAWDAKVGDVLSRLVSSLRVAIESAAKKLGR